MSWSYSKTGMTSREIEEDMVSNPPTDTETHAASLQAVKETLDIFVDKYEAGLPEGSEEPKYNVYLSGHEDAGSAYISVSLSPVPAAAS